jgi:hypothetical protein
MSPDGVALFSNTGREDFVLGVNMAGYEYEEVRVEYAKLDEKLPQLEVYMIPKDTLGDDYTTIDGKLAGLLTADAVCAEMTAWSVSGVDQRKRLLTVESSYKRELGGRYYGLIFKDGTGYLPFSIVRKVSDGTYKIDPAPQEDVSGLRLAYRVTGRVRDGTCLLRLPNRSGSASWIIRTVTEKGNAFRTLDPKEITVSTAGRRIGIDDIMSRAAPVPKDTQEDDAGMKGG